jgi:hypothetical protein
MAGDRVTGDSANTPEDLTDVTPCNDPVNVTPCMGMLHRMWVRVLRPT